GCHITASGSCSRSGRAEGLVRVDDEFLRYAGIELAVATRGVVQADDLHADHFGDVDAVPHDRLHELAVVFHHRGLAGVEAVGFRPAEAEADAQAADLGGGIHRARVFGDVEAGDTDL